MNILAKPQLENAILVDELVSIMENFGIIEGQMNGQPPEGEEEEEQSQQDIQDNQEESVPQSESKKKILDFSLVTPSEIFFLQEFNTYLKQNQMNLSQFLGSVKYQQQVKTKTKQSIVEIATSEELFELIYSQNVVPKLENGVEERLRSFLCLDQNY